MTEQEWLTCTSLSAVLECLPRKASKRKLRLFACGCCRRIWHLLPDKVNRALVAAVEDWPDGKREDPALAAAFEAYSTRKRLKGCYEGYWVVANLAFGFYKFTPLESARFVSWYVQKMVSQEHDTKVEEAAHVALFRDVFGNPFHRLALKRSWRTAAVVALAQTMYDDRRFDEMPLLADALEEAGCTEAAILKHCREPGEHVRGCWVIDLILDKN